jgi:hypothetical protein
VARSHFIQQTDRQDHDHPAQDGERRGSHDVIVFPLFNRGCRGTLLTVVLTQVLLSPFFERPNEKMNKKL